MPSPRVPVLELDLASDGWTPEERAKAMRWYEVYHGTGDISLARFIPFLIDNDPVGMKGYQRYVRALNLLRSVPRTIFFVHLYAVIGNADGCLYQINACRLVGFTKGQVLEALGYAFLSGGPGAINAVADRASAYLFSWEEKEAQPNAIAWPEGWRIDPAALRSGIDPHTTEFPPNEVDALTAWHKRMAGETPRYVTAWARLAGVAYKANRARWETGFGRTLPAQVFPLFTLQLGAYYALPTVVRRSLLHAKALGVKRQQVVEVMETAFIAGGEWKMEAVLVDDVLDMLEGWPD